MKSNKLCFRKSHFFLNIINLKMKKKTTCLKSMNKKKRTCIKSSTNSIIISEPEFYLPDDCWEHVFSFIINPLDINPVDGSEDKNKIHFKSLSLVSKHFLFIINRLIFSLRIYHPQFCFLPRFFQRFSNLNSLDLWFACSHDFDAGIALAIRDRPTLKSLSIFGIELRDENSITSHYIDSFVSLKGLNSLKFQCSRISDNLLFSLTRIGLSLKSFILENCTGYSYQGIYGLLSKCPAIQHLGLQCVDFLNNHHVFQLSLLLPDLISVNLSENSKLTELALFALIKNCPSLDEITMKHIYDFTLENINIERESLKNSNILEDFVDDPRLKFLCLSLTTFINDETIILFASIFLNLEHLDLSFCHDISKKGICQVLSRCCKLRHLKLVHSYNVRGLKINFVVQQLEELDLSFTNVDDKTLYQISKSCPGLLILSLVGCDDITEKGVMRVAENCTQLKEISLTWCDKVNVDVVVSMLSSRPTLHVF